VTYAIVTSISLPIKFTCTGILMIGVYGLGQADGHLSDLPLVLPAFKVVVVKGQPNNTPKYNNVKKNIK